MVSNMKLEESYVSNDFFQKEKLKDANFKTDKIILGDDAFAICDLINSLINQFEKNRVRGK